jgi:hypothetical protein
VIFCIIMTIIQYYKYGRVGYIGILYVVSLIIDGPVVLISLLIAACFDIVEWQRKRK